MSEIQVLTELDQIRLRTNMFLDNSNYNHLITEVLDNSLDEVINGFAKKVSIDISDETFTVTDDGRGIQISQVKMPDGSTEDSIVAICTKLFSSGKFNQNNYEKSIGLHGVGLTVVSALSEWLNISIKSRENEYIYYNYLFVDSKLDEKKEIISDEKVTISTRVSFKPNEKYFKTNELEIQKIYNRLLFVSSKIQDSNFYINGRQIPKLIFDDFISKQLELENKNLSKISYKDNESKVDLFYVFDDLSKKSSPNIIGDVNLNICEGTYITNISTLFFKIIKEIVNDDRLTKSDALSFLRIYCSIEIPNIEFEGQHKVKMTKDLTSLFNKLYSDIKSKLDIFSIKERFQNLIKLKYENIAIKSLSSSGSRVSNDNPLCDCLKTPGDILYILEGESAKGTLKRIRDNQKEAIFPLTGKIKNTINNNLEEALSNLKIKYLLEAIGVGSKIRYNRIVLIADSDPDGLHVNLLSAIVIWKFAPTLIKEGKVSVLLPPLYGARKKNEFIPIYDFKEINKYRDLEYSIRRFKGLGEFNPDELEVVVHKFPFEYVLTYPTNQIQKDAIEQCITNVELKRFICSEKTFGIHRVFETINQSKRSITV